MLVAVAIDETDQPGLDWAKLLVCTGIGAAIGLGLALLRRRTTPQALVRRGASSAQPSAG